MRGRSTRLNDSNLLSKFAFNGRARSTRFDVHPVGQPGSIIEENVSSVTQSVVQNPNLSVSRCSRELWPFLGHFRYICIGEIAILHLVANVVERAPKRNNERRSFAVLSRVPSLLVPFCLDKGGQRFPVRDEKNSRVEETMQF